MNKNFKTSIDGSKLNAAYGTLTGIKIRSIDYITGIATWNAVAGGGARLKFRSGGNLRKHAGGSHPR